MKKVWKIVIVPVLAVVVGQIGRKMLADEGTYYTKIDNNRMEEIVPNNGVVNFEGSFPYRYTLYCHNQTGKEKELSFTAEKILREGAFLALEVSPVRGVTGWAEVQYDELPAAVQEIYSDTGEE